jgi:hypothetical protein
MVGVTTRAGTASGDRAVGDGAFATEFGAASLAESVTALCVELIAEFVPALVACESARQPPSAISTTAIAARHAARADTRRRIGAFNA